MPTPAIPCQAVADPICSDLQFTFESGNEEQKSESKNGTQNLVSVMMCRFESDHRHSLEINELFNRDITPVDTPPGVMHDKIGGHPPRKKVKPFIWA